MFLTLPYRWRQYLPDSVLQTQAVCFLFHRWRQRWYIPGCTLTTKTIFFLLYPEKKGTIILMKVATGYQITRRQNSEDGKYGTYGEHLKKVLRVGLYTVVQKQLCLILQSWCWWLWNHHVLTLKSIQLQMAFLVPAVRTCYDHRAEKLKIGELFYFHSHQNVEIRKTCYFYRHIAQGNKYMSPIQGRWYQHLKRKLWFVVWISRSAEIETQTLKLPAEIL